LLQHKNRRNTSYPDYIEDDIYEDCVYLGKILSSVNSVFKYFGGHFAYEEVNGILGEHL
jgi:hypothetical protein